MEQGNLILYEISFSPEEKGMRVLAVLQLEALDVSRKRSLERA